MPTVAYFLGIAVRIFFNDHPPPHFHASYGDYRGRVLIETGEMMEGDLPPRIRRLLRDWTIVRRTELNENWERARQGMPLLQIAGLDQDD